MDFPEVRKFLMSSYNDLPNILFMGSLILGSLLGHLPLIWMALGLILNGSVTAVAQLVLKYIKDAGFLGSFASQLQTTAKNHGKCYVGYHRTVEGTFNGLSGSDTVMLTPSYWMSAASFFTGFSIYNSIQVTAREPKGKVDPLLVSARRAFSLSTLIIGIFFLGIVLARAFTGCESLVGGTLGVLLGLGVAIGYWHLLDGCGSGKMPDILQVVGSMAPDHSKTQQPVMCSVPAPQKE